MEVEISQNFNLSQSNKYQIKTRQAKYNLRTKNANNGQYIDEGNTKKSTEDQAFHIEKMILKNKNKSAKTKPKRTQWIILEYPLRHYLVFPLIGNVMVEIYNQEKIDFDFQIKEVQKNTNYFSLYPNYIQSISQFDNIINMLLKSQCQRKFQLSQLLKKYQGIVLEQLAIFDELGKEIQTQSFQQLVAERKKFKLQFTKDYIKSQLKDEDFFVVSNVGINFTQKTSQLDSFHISKAYCCLIGVDEEQFSNLFFRYRTPFLFLSQKARESVYMQYIQAYINEDFQEPVVINDFEINTQDELTFYCHNQKQFLKVEYPSHLTHPKLDKLHLLFDNINFTKVNVSEGHLKQIIENRALNNKIQFEDFEYTLLSQIFMEKFYPQELSEIQKNIEKQEKHEQEIQKFLQLENKRCSYKPLNNSLS